MSTLRSVAVFGPAAVVVIAACGSDNAGGARDASTAASGDCDAIQNEARDTVSRAIDANKTCTTTADCVDVSFSTSCFDSCSRGVAKSGTAAVDAAKADAEKNVCPRFKEKGCKSIIPPCAPPSLRCVDGKCES